MSDSSTKAPSIPAWQQNHKSESESPAVEHPHGSDPTTQMSHAELLEQAKEFLKDVSIRDASRERKVAFLQKKGLQSSDIEQLLQVDSSTSSDEQSGELRTVHDSNTSNDTTKSQPEESESIPPEKPSTPSPTPIQLPQRDIPPIITYPEFLLKPQKPPPLITIPRLVNAAYAFAGLATLTYSTSKYLVQPMLESLTEARHSLASTTLTDLEKLNNKLESTVSHIPYIASAAALRKSHEHDRDDHDDNDSIISDPTELFHRDIATQTTPSLSRRNSRDNSNDDSNAHLDATTQQVQRLSSLHDSLTSLVHSLDPKELPYLPPPANKKLHETISDFQSVLDRLETTYNPFRTDYYTSIYASADGSKSKAGGKDNDVAAKVRVEIRNLKGLFLSARNFPTAPRPANTYASR